MPGVRQSARRKAAEPKEDVPPVKKERATRAKGGKKAEEEKKPAKKNEKVAKKEEPVKIDESEEETDKNAEAEENGDKIEDKEEEEAKDEKVEPEDAEESDEKPDKEVEKEAAAPAKKGRGKRAPAKVTVEHCKSWRVYNRNAVQITDGIREEFPDVEVELNPTKPRSKSFEITVTFDDGESELVWSGINKGPPRKLKFPELEEVLKEILKHMWSAEIMGWYSFGWAALVYFSRTNNFFFF